MHRRQLLINSKYILRNVSFADGGKIHINIHSFIRHLTVICTRRVHQLVVQSSAIDRLTVLHKCYREIFIGYCDYISEIVFGINDLFFSIYQLIFFADFT